MKRILAVFAALCLAFGGLNALAEGLFDDVAGTWVMTRYIVDNRVIDDPAAAGSAKVVLFNEDGSAVVTINQNVYHGTWRQEGGAVHLLYDDGDQADFILNADQLVYQPEGQVQYFTRQVIYNESSDFKFRVMTDGTVEILGYSGASPTVNIPDTLNGAPVPRSDQRCVACQRGYRQALRLLSLRKAGQGEPAPAPASDWDLGLPGLRQSDGHPRARGRGNAGVRGVFGLCPAEPADAARHAAYHGAAGVCPLPGAAARCAAAGGEYAG